MGEKPDKPARGPEKDIQPFEIIPPAQIAQLVEDIGVRKTELTFVQTLMLSILAGAFIAFGAALYTVAITGSETGFGATRLLGGAAFSFGLIMVIVGGAELFTGNSLIVMAWVDSKIPLSGLLRNWTIVFIGTALGAAGIAFLVHVSGIMGQSDGDVSVSARTIAEAKVSLAPLEAFIRGVLCNILVCMAVWMSCAARSAAGKAIVIFLPVMAFVALGFEHSVANMYLLPIGALQEGSTLGAVDVISNLFLVSIGNIVGGGGLVALVYWMIYSPRKN